MVKAAFDILQNFSFTNIEEKCLFEDKLEALLNKYIQDNFKFKIEDKVLIIKTTSATEKWSISSQSKKIIEDIQETLGMSLKIKCDVIPML